MMGIIIITFCCAGSPAVGVIFIWYSWIAPNTIGRMKYGSGADRL